MKTALDYKFKIFGSRELFEIIYLYYDSYVNSHNKT